MARRRDASSRAVDRDVAVLLAVYFSGWALLRPPLQTPDEPQHLMKANSILLQPWKSAPGQFDLDRRFVNPLALDTPEPIDKLFFRPFNAMTSDDIEAVQRVPWPDRTQPGAARRRTPARLRAIPRSTTSRCSCSAEPLVRRLRAQRRIRRHLPTVSRPPRSPRCYGPWCGLTLVRTARHVRRRRDRCSRSRSSTRCSAFISSGVTPDAVNNAAVQPGPDPALAGCRVGRRRASPRSSCCSPPRSPNRPACSCRASRPAVLIAFAAVRGSIVAARHDGVGGRRCAAAIVSIASSTTGRRHVSWPAARRPTRSASIWHAGARPRLHVAHVLGAARVARLHGQSGLVRGGPRAGGA